MSSPAVFTVANPDLMAAILAEWGQGQVWNNHLLNSVANQLASLSSGTECLLLVGDENNMKGVDWAAIIERVDIDTEGTTVTVRDALPLHNCIPLSQVKSFDGRTLSRRSARGYVQCTISEKDVAFIRHEMAKRRQVVAAVKAIDVASPYEWKHALLEVEGRLTERQRVMLRTHAEAPFCTARMGPLAGLAGRKADEEGMSEYFTVGELLAEALGAKLLPDFGEVVSLGVVKVDTYDPKIRELRRPLAAALLDLGWAVSVGAPHSASPTANLLLKAASEEAELDPLLRDESPTVRESLVLARIGQGRYRERVLQLWGGRCALTGASTALVLVASHVLPWASSDNKQRLDPYNGLLLAASVDRLFDAGLISFTDKGELLKTPSLEDEDLEVLGIKTRACLRFVAPQHVPYLRGHRQAFGFGVQKSLTQI